MYNKLYFCESTGDRKVNHVSPIFIILFPPFIPPPPSFFHLHTRPFTLILKVLHIFTEKFKARTLSLFSLRFFQVKYFTSRIQSACKFNPIIQLGFTLQKLRHKSTLVKLGTIQVLDKPFTKTNGKTLSTCVCSNTVNFLWNLTPHEHFVLYLGESIQIS